MAELKSAAFPSQGRTKRAYPSVIPNSAGVINKTITNESSLLLRYLRDLKGPCTVDNIINGLGLHIDRSEAMDMLDSLVDQGRLRCKKYNANEIYIYNASHRTEQEHTGPSKTKRPSKSTLEKEVSRLRSSISKCSEKLGLLRDLSDRSKELCDLQYRQKKGILYTRLHLLHYSCSISILFHLVTALEEWHALLKAGNDLRALAVASGGDCERLLAANNAKSAELALLQRLYAHIVAGVCEAEGVRPRELCQRLGIEAVTNPPK
ncbi:uncharacterized protein BXIN_2853 [Babesia sp. Xinjiang]|uniref:uncharacterized protein n=1 Tax=Babesia sp. Xinjiang TaxID=462227 RepID=UPI000A255CFC|nr:uncharacterized protein BXIN_2853 [Babesia sp. Xinjiang]ORM39503.1 hypothetical protein BXIN_2853 [Babesia sp. Xinjiang]